METFRVLKLNEATPKGFKLAKFKDLVNAEKLKEVLGTGHICQLQDGKVAGHDYGYEIKQLQQPPELGHKLLVKTLYSGKKVLEVANVQNPLPNEFEVAQVADIVRLDMLKDALSDKTWHICKLADGHVMGPGYGYHVKQTPYHSSLGHKLVIRPSEVAEVNKLCLPGKEAGLTEEETFQAPKRKRGRPKRKTVTTETEQKKDSKKKRKVNKLCLPDKEAGLTEEETFQAPKRKRGRPKRKTVTTETKQKKDSKKRRKGARS